MLSQCPDPASRARYLERFTKRMGDLAVFAVVEAALQPLVFREESAERHLVGRPLPERGGGDPGPRDLGCGGADRVGLH